MKVMYRLDGDRVEDLERLIVSRPELMLAAAKACRHGRPADAARDAWADAVTMFWLGHDRLYEFDRHELRFDLGKMDKITVTIDNSDFDIKERSVVVDWRLAGWENEVVAGHKDDLNVQLVQKIEFDDIEFERKRDEPDARGRYEYDFTEDYKGQAIKIEVCGVVVLKEGKYHLAVQADTVISIQHTLNAMSLFAFAVINGEIPPKIRVIEKTAE